MIQKQLINFKSNCAHSKSIVSNGPWFPLFAVMAPGECAACGEHRAHVTATEDSRVQDAVGHGPRSGRRGDRDRGSIGCPAPEGGQASPPATRGWSRHA